MHFIRVHRSAIVRVDRVRALRDADDGSTRLILRDGTEIPVSRRRREQVASRLRQKFHPGVIRAPLAAR